MISLLVYLFSHGIPGLHKLIIGDNKLLYLLFQPGNINILLEQLVPSLLMHLLFDLVYLSGVSLGHTLQLHVSLHQFILLQLHLLLVLFQISFEFLDFVLVFLFVVARLVTHLLHSFV